MTRYQLELALSAGILLCSGLFATSTGNAQSADHASGDPINEASAITNVRTTCHDSIPQGLLPKILSPLARFFSRHRPILIASARFTIETSKDEGEIIFTRIGTNRIITSRFINGALVSSTHRRNRDRRTTYTFRFPRAQQPHTPTAFETALSSPAIIAATIECFEQPPINANAPRVETCQNVGSGGMQLAFNERERCIKEGTNTLLECNRNQIVQVIHYERLIDDCLDLCTCPCCRNPDSGCSCDEDDQWAPSSKTGYP